MWEIGTGKFGVRHDDGSFDYERYAEVMKNPAIVATKLKLAQGAKPGGGGILPAAKVTKEIAAHSPGSARRGLHFAEHLGRIP